MLKKILLNSKYILSSFLRFFKRDVSIHVERSWSTDTAIGIKGVVEAPAGTIDKMKVTVNNTSAQVTSWTPLESNDITKYPPHKETREFWVEAPRTAEHKATFTITQTNQKSLIRTLRFSGSAPQPPKGIVKGDQIYNDFIRRVNDEHLHVLEIGSRILPPKTDGMRVNFPQAGSYTGFDYYPDSNTDVVGDAHRLSSYFGDKKFDAIFSIAVFEHIAMPWVVAMEINKLLKIGGITYHQIPFAWPAHELPWDFWRCSDEGLKVLFSKGLGFETVAAGMYHPLRMNFDKPFPGQEQFPEFPSFGCSALLSKKTEEIDLEKFKWDIETHEVLGNGSHYPEL